MAAQHKRGLISGPAKRRRPLRVGQELAAVQASQAGPAAAWDRAGLMAEPTTAADRPWWRRQRRQRQRPSWWGQQLGLVDADQLNPGTAAAEGMADAGGGPP